MKKTTLVLLLLILTSLCIKTKFIFTAAPMPFNSVTDEAIEHFQNWDQFGMKAQHYTPTWSRFSKPSGGRMLAPDNHIYYISYPPLTFIATYGILKLFRLEFSQKALRAIDTVVYFLVCGFLFGAVKTVTRSTEAALVALLTYSFSMTVMSDQTVVFWSQTYTHLLIAIQIYLASRIVYDGKKLNLALILISFLACSTDWTGILSTFFIALIGGIKYRKTAIALLATIPVALGLMVIQFSSIGGFTLYTTSLKSKFIERSSAHLDWRTYVIVGQNFIYAYWTVIPIFLMLILLRDWKLKRKDLIFFSAVVLPPVTHILFLLQYNAIHNFEMLKMSLPIAILAGLVVAGNNSLNFPHQLSES